VAYESDFVLINLQRQLVEHFDLGEMQQLCFDLSIDYDELAGDTKTDKARELVKFGYRNGRIPEIVQRCAELRPQEIWNKPAKIYAHDGLPDEWIEPLQRLHRLVKEFNRNRQLPFNNERTRQGDEIAFTMREAAPFLFGQLDVGQWLKSDSIGKRLAVVKYLDWLQDVEFAGSLLRMLVTEKPFLQLHVLLAIDSMIDQLDWRGRKTVTAALTIYKIVSRDADLRYWRERILSRLSSQNSRSLQEG